MHYANRAARPRSPASTWWERNVRTVVVNGAIVAWAILLIYAPAFAWAVTRKPSPTVFAVGGLASLIAMSIIGYVAGDLGVEAVDALRCLVVVLGLVLAFALYRVIYSIVRRRESVRAVWTEWIIVPLSAFLGFWALAPALISLHRLGLTFGLTSLGNSDLPNYVLAAQNLALAGFRDTHHIANVNIGHGIPTGTPIGPIALIVFISAATGLSALQVAMAAMGVAVCALSVGLWALGRAIWPKAHFAVGVSVVISAMAALPLYNYAQYFLGAELGCGAIAVTAAGVVGIGRNWSSESIVCVVFGGAFGIYGYSPLGIPALLVVPFATAGLAFASGRHDLRVIGRSVAVALAAEAAALIVASIALGDAVAVARLQRDADAGWHLAVASGTTAIFWPNGIGRPQSHLYIAASWLIVAVVVAIGLFVAWQSGEKYAAYTGALFFVAAAAIAVLFAHLYGATRYQTWKIESFLIPVAGVSIFPAFGASIARVRKFIGRAALIVVSVVALIGPWMLWSGQISATPNPALVTDRTLMGLSRSPAMSNLAVINIRLPYPVTSMSAGAIFDKSVVVFTQASYYVNLTDLNTCTLTMRALLAPGETSFTDLGGGYVLLNRPSACDYKN